jgi:hypothetical protein
MARPGDSVVHVHSVKHFEGSQRMLHALAVPTPKPRYCCPVPTLHSCTAGERRLCHDPLQVSSASDCCSHSARRRFSVLLSAISASPRQCAEHDTGSRSPAVRGLSRPPYPSTLQQRRRAVEQARNRRELHVADPTLEGCSQAPRPPPHGDGGSKEGGRGRREEGAGGGATRQATEKGSGAARERFRRRAACGDGRTGTGS